MKALWQDLSNLHRCGAVPCERAVLGSILFSEGKGHNPSCWRDTAPCCLHQSAIVDFGTPVALDARAFRLDTYRHQPEHRRRSLPFQMFHLAGAIDRRQECRAEYLLHGATSSGSRQFHRRYLPPTSQDRDQTAHVFAGSWFETPQLQPAG